MTDAPKRHRTRGFSAAETSPDGLAARAAAMRVAGPLPDGPDRTRALERAVRRARAAAGGAGYDLMRHAALIAALKTERAARTARPRPTRSM